MVTVGMEMHMNRIVAVVVVVIAVVVAASSLSYSSLATLTVVRSYTVCSFLNHA